MSDLEARIEALEAELEELRKRDALIDLRADAITVKQLIEALSILPPDASVSWKGESPVTQVPFCYAPSVKILTLDYPYRDGYDFWDLSYFIDNPEKITP